MEGLAINLATVRAQWDMAEAIEGCLRHGISAIAPWRDQVAAIGLDRAARLVRENGLRVTGLCRGGFFPATTAEERATAVEDNRRAVDEAAALGADCLVMVVGGCRRGRVISGAAREMVRDGLAAMLPHARAAGVKVAIEPLHPVYAAERACVNTLKHALDLADELGEGVGAAIDVYHVWWDPELEGQLMRAGQAGQILAHHICDLLVPTRDPLNDRGMMGDGVVDLERIRGWFEAAGFPRAAGGGDLLRGELVEAGRGRGAADLRGAIPRGVLRRLRGGHIAGRRRPPADALTASATRARGVPMLKRR